MQLRRRMILVVVAALPAVGCAPKVSPIGPGSVFRPDAREQRIWQTAENDSRILRSKGILYEDPALESYVNSVLTRLLQPDPGAYAPLTCRAYVINSPEMNAFSLPNGDTFLYGGILGRIRNEAQLAMLLGHEITHSTHRHLYLRYEDMYARTGTAAYISVVTAVGGGNIQNMASGLSQLVAIAGISGYSRDKERESDRTGLMMMAKAGYDPGEGSKFFQNVLDATDRKARRYSALYATHPKMKERVTDCTELANKIPPDLLANAKDKGTDRYLAVTAGLIHHDIERQIARGRYDLAESAAMFLVENKSDDAVAYAYLGEVRRIRNANGELALAREDYTRAIAIDAQQTVALRGLGFLCLKDGTKEDALRYLKAYVSAAPDAADAAYVRQTIERLEPK